MKKHLLLLSLVYIAITAYGQNSIPNGNFETWNTGTYDYPQNYPYTSNSEAFFRYQLPFNVTKTTDAYHGAYAVQLTTNASATDTAIGYFINGNPSGSNWHGGMPYNQTPTGIRGYYKYNIAFADSALIVASFSKAGNNIGQYFFKIGGIKTSYTLFNFTFSPALSVTPDSVMFAATSSDDVMGDNGGIPGCILKIDSVSFTGVSSQPALMNGDFELWQSQILYTPDNWYVQSDMGEGFNRTTDAAAGDYAIELITYLGDNDGNPVARPGQISNGYWDNSCNCMKGGYPFSNQVDTLAFWYKYSPSATDSAQISLNFKKNGSDFQWAGMNLHAATTYQYKEVPFNIGQAPDTVIVQIQSSLWNDSLVSFVGSDLIIDEIHFKSQPLNTSILNYKNDNSISIFPNPTNGKFLIQGLGFGVQSLEIYNVLAEKVYSTANFQQQTLNEIDLSKFQKGIYFAKIYNGEKIYTKKIVIQ